MCSSFLFFEDMSMDDVKWMKEAIKQAKKAESYDEVPIGCVIVKDDKVIARGYNKRETLQQSIAHAEIMAIQKACKKLNTWRLEDCILYVTLEPCAHYGKTPPCVDMVIKKGISRVVIGSLDPNPLVAGRGIRKLKENGIEVKIGVLEDKCKEMSKIFMKYITSQRPYVVLKSAMTIDGKISTAIGKSKWITGKEARLEGHKLRNELKGIMVGVNTIIADNPELTCRIDKGRNPIRIVVDSKLRIPLDAKVVNDQFKNKTIIATTEMAHKGKLKLLKDRGIDVIILEAKNNKVDLDRLMVSLAERKIDSILLEGGAELNYSALAEGIVDEVNIFIAPKIIGGREAKSAIAGDGVKELSQAFKLEKMSVGFIGEDIWIKGKVKRGE